MLIAKYANIIYNLYKIKNKIYYNKQHITIKKIK